MALDQLDVALDSALVVDVTSLIQAMTSTISPVSRHVRAALMAASGAPLALPEQGSVDPSSCEVARSCLVSAGSCHIRTSYECGGRPLIFFRPHDLGSS